ncbi:MAG: uroporphyrinogen decarboxylase family protein [Spirochaetia bacterium]
MNYEWPDPGDTGRFINIGNTAQGYTENMNKACTLGTHIAEVLESALFMRGFENFFIDMMINPGFAESLLDIITEHKIRYWEKAIDTAGENVLIIRESDDLGTQETTMLSPELYRKYIMPRHKRLFNSIRKAAKHKVYIFLHSCGAVRDLIPYLIEEGVDILNPIQVNAQGMNDTRDLKKLYGNDLTFWGGAVDNQQVLSRGTPQEIHDEVERRIGDLAPGGGFVCSTIHNVQPDIPPQNYIAMWETLQQCGVY